MTNSEIAALTDRHTMNTYGRVPVAFVRGEGCRVWDADGKQYLDFVAGIAVNALGYAHPRLVKAVSEQAAAITHTSNLYLIEPQARLAARLCELSFGDKAFFCNSGAEAVEGAVKLARKYGHTERGEECHKIITAHQSFHGRTLTAITATAQPKYQKHFHPLAPGFQYVPFNDLAALEQTVDDNTCAVMLEPIQVEGAAVRVGQDEYLRGVRRLCTERGALLIYDEVQTGAGRTGMWFGYEHAGAVPDVMTLAKALGGGVPIGALVASDAAAVLEPGEHASTFGGNHLACAAALAVLNTLEEDKLLDNAQERGGQLLDGIAELQKKHPIVLEGRGKGLLLAMELKTEQARQLQDLCLEKGLVLNALSDTALRIVPPLIVTAEECDEALGIIEQALEGLAAEA
ncbi:MAG: acetylornithine transaminase [Armatimonadota bacterium]|jgi:predicted acetylornithine/succinylornithine family transaminase